MLMYYILFCYPLFFLINPFKFNNSKNYIFYYFYGCILIFIIGFRFEVGGDWSNYLDFYNSYDKMQNYEKIIKINLQEINKFRFSPLLDLLSIKEEEQLKYRFLTTWNIFDYLNKNELGYSFLNIFSNIFNFGIYGVNFFISFIFVTALLLFCIKNPHPWLGVLISTPYIILVVSMGASRQTAALAFILLIYTYWNKLKILQYILLTFFASLFHKSGVIILFYFNILKINKKYFHYYLILFLILIVFLTFYFFQTYIPYFTIVTRHTTADGSLLKIFMNITAGASYFGFKFIYNKTYEDDYLWFVILITSIIFFIFNDVASAAFYRISIYFMPIQIIAYCRIINLVENTNLKFLFIYLVSMMYFFVLITWFNYSNHSEMHLPYNLIRF